MSEPTPTNSSPFVGPTALRTGQPIFGRDTEQRDLGHLLVAERLVLLYSPSGAGKTSLIQAGIIPQLRRRGFLPMPTVRVSLPPPTSLPADAAINPHTLSVMRCLESRRREPIPDAELAGLSLTAYAERRLRPLRRASYLLIFDQFEEIITLNPFARAQKEQFFRELGALLQRAKIWALFAAREDFVGALTPYLTLIPTRLRASFRLGFFDRASAELTITATAAQGRVSFTPAAADSLARHLSAVKVRRLDGSVGDDFGPVEPVQLQVVCQDLWLRLNPQPGSSIGEPDLGETASLDQALGRYYDTAIAAIAEGDVAAERGVRDWVGRALITPQGLRSQVMREPDKPDELPDATMRRLVDAYLVREETRRGFTWVELAHDRLVQPVRASNKAWALRNLAPHQRQADQWAAADKPDDLLLRGAALEEAERWLFTSGVRPTPNEDLFLAKSRRLNEQITREAQMRDASQAQALAARALRLLRLGGGDELATLLARQAFLFHERGRGQTLDQVDEALRAVLSREFASAAVTLPEVDLLAVAFSPGGDLLAVGCEDGAVRVWSMSAPGMLAGVLSPQGRPSGVNALAFAPSGRVLAAGREDGDMFLLSLDDPRATPTPFFAHRLGVTALAFDRPGARLFSAGRDGRVRVWDLARLDAPAELGAPAGAINALAMRPDSDELAVGGEDQEVRLWAVPPGETLPGEPHFRWQLPDYVTSLAFSLDGGWLAAGGRNRRVYLFDFKQPQAEALELRGYGAPLAGLAFSPSGRRLVTAANDGRVRLWAFPRPLPAVGLDDFRSRPPTAHNLPVSESRIDAIALSRDGRFLVTGAERQMRVWEIGRPPGTPFVVRAGAAVRDLAFSPAGTRLAAVTASGDVHVWGARGDPTAQVALAATARQPLDDLALRVAGEARAVAFSPDGRTLAVLAAGDDAALTSFDLAALRQTSVTLKGQGPALRTLAFAPGGGHVAAAGLGQELVTCSTARRAVWRRARPASFDGEVARLLLQPDGALKIAASAAGATVLLWDGPGDAVRVLTQAEGTLRAISLSSDGARLAAGGTGRTLAIWKLGAPDEARPTLLAGPNATICAAAFSPDGTRVAVGCEDGTIWLWPAGHTADPPVVLERHEAPVVALAFAPDGRVLAAGDANGSVRLWITTTPTLAELARLRVWRNLSSDEWRQFVGEEIGYELTCLDLPPGEGA